MVALLYFNFMDVKFFLVQFYFQAVPTSILSGLL